MFTSRIRPSKKPDKTKNKSTPDHELAKRERISDIEPDPGLIKHAI